MSSVEKIEAIRAASRQLVRELGFMGGKFAGTDLSPSAVHALLEIEKGDCVTASYLSDCLQLEKSSVSRMLRKLMVSGDITEKAHASDARRKQLVLTRKGKVRVNQVHAYAQSQISKALDSVDENQQQTIISGLQTYASALSGQVIEKSSPTVILSKGYTPGIIAKVTEMQSLYYARTTGFGQTFESAVASGLAEFCGRLHRPQNEIWLAKLGTEVVGAIAIDGDDLGNGKAHLRWFIVDDKTRGTGVGQKLLSEALRFVDGAGFSETHLDTVAGLEAAHHLYRKYGFSCIEETVGSRWGKEMTEQCFVRYHPDKKS